MSKPVKFFVIAEFFYNLAIPAARSRKMISLADAAKVPEEYKAEYLAYQNAIFCFTGGILLVLIIPMIFTLVAAVALGIYGYRQAEKIYPSLAYNIASLLPAKGGKEAMAAYLAQQNLKAQTGSDNTQDTDSAEDDVWLKPRLAEKGAAEKTQSEKWGKRGEVISGSGPWMVYVIDETGAERRLPRRFEDETAAQRHADTQRRGKIQHSGVVYAPEN